MPFSQKLNAANANPKKVAACKPVAAGAPTLASVAAAAAAAPLPAANAPLAAAAANANGVRNKEC